MEQASDDGPAEPGSPLRAALDLLIIRGCTIEYTPEAPNTLESYVCRYRYGSMSRARMFYADKRGVSQALGLLKELADDAVFEAVAAGYNKALAKSIQQTRGTVSSKVYETVVYDTATKVTT